MLPEDSNWAQEADGGLKSDHLQAKRRFQANDKVL